jgi:hypothetical protein
VTTREPLLPGDTLLLRPMGGLARATSVLVVLTCVLALVDVWADWNRYQLVDDYLADVSGVTFGDIEGADSTSLTVGILLLLVTIAAGVVFIVWLWRARVNAEQIHPEGHRMRRGWTIGGWFCPVVNLWFPFRIVTDVWVASLPPGTTGSNATVARWWTAWIATFVASIWLRAELRGEITVDLLRDVAVANTVATIAQCLAGVFVLVVIRQISSWQAVPRRA